MDLPPIDPQVLPVLDALTVDPAATAAYEWLSGGLMWSDELPQGAADRRIVTRNYLTRYVFAYRAALTLGKERAEFRQYWEQIQINAPHWPGLRADRRGENARVQLVAGQESLMRDLEKFG